MSSQAEMLINQAEAAFTEARHFRESAERMRNEAKTNIDNAIETAEQESDEPDKAQYWRQKADELKQRMEHDVTDMEQKAKSKHDEAKRYESEAHNMIEQEKDEQKKGMLRQAFQRVMENSQN